ncbi:hypothetical protein H0H92_012234 [Tricholoma furcatifolium]|nr:hypothetical protein H0H92_012234 [Tricholoma furcatifolium]
MPGTARPGSGECLGCGQLGHLAASCTAEVKLPEYEFRWRRKVNFVKRDATTPRTVSVNLVDDDGDDEPTAAIALTQEQLASLIEEHVRDALEKQGKGQGAQRSVLEGGRESLGDILATAADCALDESHVLDNDEYNIIDLYSVRDVRQDTTPFYHQLKVHGPNGEIVRVWAHVDDGAMVDAMSLAMWTRVRHRLAALRPSTRRLRMANGTVITPVGQWDGVVEAGGLCREAAFEVFDSGGGWDFLFGKRLLTTFGAVHDYISDTIQLSVDGACTTLHNQIEAMSASMPKEREEVSLVGDMTSPSRGVPARSLPSDVITEHPFDAAPQPEDASNSTSPIQRGAG